MTARLPIAEIANIATYLGLAREHIDALMQMQAPPVDMAEEIAQEMETAANRMNGDGFWTRLLRRAAADLHAMALKQEDANRA